MRKTTKIITVMLLAVGFSLTAFGQNQTSENTDAVLGYGDMSSYVIASFDDADTIGIGDSTYTFVLRNKSQKQLKYYATISLDSINDRRDTTTVDVELWDKVSSEESYTKRKSFTWANGSDITGSLETDSFRISEFVKIRVVGEFDEFNAKPTYLFIKSVEE